MKLKFLVLLLFSFLNSYSFCKESTLIGGVSIESNVSALVDGCVNAITGDFIDSNNDIVVVGPEPLVFERYSSSSDYAVNNFCSGWRHNHDSWINKIRTKGKKYDDPDMLDIAYVETSGRAAYYKGFFYDNRDYVHCKMDQTSYNFGLTNCGSGVISAKTNFKNTHLYFDRDSRDIKVVSPNGSVLQFSRHKHRESFDLDYERKANRRQLFYSYDKKGVVTDVKLMDGSGNHLLSSLHFEDDVGKDHTMEITASDGQKVIYTFEKGKSVEKDKENGLGKRYLMSSVKRFGEVLDTYEYIKRQKTGGNMISCHHKPDQRFKKIRYYRDEEIELDKFDFRMNQVLYLEAPVGPDNKPIITYRFHYFADVVTFTPHKTACNGHTDVFDASLHKTTYHFKHKRLKFIEKFSGIKNYTLYSKEQFSWGKLGTQDAFNLLSRNIEDGNGKSIIARTFEYDKRGNIIAQRLYGEITGRSQPLICYRSHPIENDCERYTHRFTHSDKTMNLLMTESEDNGKSTHYHYQHGTDFLSRKFILDHDFILQRYFYDYDLNGVVVRAISDNGFSSELGDFNNVTVRKITHTFPRMTSPVGVPERTDEMYLDLATKQEVLLKRICREFSPQGKLLKEDHYDSNGVYGYSLTRSYDARGNVIEESDARGNITYRTYDLNNNLTSERKPGELHSTRHSYDFSNRLIRTEEIHDNGTLLITTHRYNHLGNKVATVDPFGHTTEYQYDEFGQVILTTKPPIVGADGTITKPTVVKQYDVLGNVTCLIDEEGQAVHTTYNIHGKPLNVKYPDGTQESFQYYLDGTLEKHYARNGTFTHFQRDIFDRVTKKEVYSHEQGTLLSQESFVFNGTQLLSATDAEGKITRYRYDGAGRVIAIEDGGRLTTQEYDSFGHLSHIHEWYDETHCKTTLKIYNPSGQVLEEKVIEGDKLFRHNTFEYDIQGNVVARTEFNQAGEASTTYTQYNWHKQPTKTIDALGNVTHIRYDYKAIDSNGLQVLQTTLTDPLGNQSITTHNTHGKVASLVKKNSMGKVIAKKEIFYKGNGDVHYTKETAIAANAADRIICTRWNLDFFHQVHDLIEAEGTPEQKHTHFDYNGRGQKVAQVKPDGTIIHFAYDNKGRLERQHASDASFDYQYTFDRSDRIIAVQDLINNTTTERIYNNQGNLEEERLGNGLSIKYRYDRLDRPLEVILPDDSNIQYSYDACNLREVQRYERKFAYQDFHLVAHPKLIALPAEAGELVTEYDIMGRPKKVEGGDIIEEVFYDCVGNLVRADMHSAAASNLEDALCEYTYDDLYQLKSESGFATHSYQNDSLYNCIDRDGKARVFNALHQLIQEGNTNYTYNANGALICQETEGDKTHYKYDAFDRLTSVQKGDELTKYTYDVFHRRLSKQHVNGEVIRYIYQGENEVGACDKDNHIYQLRVLGIGKGAEIGASLAFELDGEVFYPVHDHNGNVLTLVDDEGTVRENYRYSAFGEAKIFDIKGEVVLNSLLNNPWKFSSKRQDEESRLVYFGRRYYDPAACRWISPDPLGFEAGPNLYAYVMNSPLSHIDLYGLIASKAESANLGFFHNMFQTLHRGLDSLVKTPGRCIQMAGLHGIPIPEVGSVIRLCGRFIAGEKPTWQSGWDYDHSENIPMPGENIDGVRTALVNGILTTKDAAINMCSGVGSALRGLALTILHGSTEGFSSDILECIALILGFKPRSVYMAADGLQKDIANLKEGEILHVIAHSQGGLITDRALEMLAPYEKKRIFVTTYGTAKIIDKDEHGLAGARNNICNKDPVPFIANPIGYIRARMDNSYGNTNFCSGEGFHGFDSKVYQKCLQDDIKHVRQFAGSKNE